ACDHSCQDNDCQVRFVLLHPWVAEGEDFIRSGCQTHRASPVQGARIIQIALRQFELDFSLKTRMVSHNTLPTELVRNLRGPVPSTRSRLHWFWRCSRLGRTSRARHY